MSANTKALAILAELRNAITPLVLLPSEVQAGEDRSLVEGCVIYRVDQEALDDADASIVRVQALCAALAIELGGIG